MERFGFIHGELDTRILILFVLRRLPRPVDMNTLAELCFCDSERDKDAALSAIMSDSAYEKYQAARSKGIDTYEYVAFLRAISDFSGDGKQQRVWDYINSLPLSTAQKDQLHYAAGYKESSLAKTPWH